MPSIKPYPWQVPHINRLIEAFQRHPYVLDASDTGTGKTITALFAAKALGQRPFVVAPKIILHAWTCAARDVGVDLLDDPVNIEKLKSNHPMLTRLPDTRARKPISNWRWNLDPGQLIVWDEVHNAGGLDTQNARVLYALHSAKLPALLMSATIANDPMRLRSAGYLLGLHNYVDHRAWALRHGCVRNPFALGYALMFSKSLVMQETALRNIHKVLFPAKGSRMRIADIDEFPENLVLAEAYDSPDRKKVQEIYDGLEDMMHDSKDDEIPLVKLLRARQNVELLKVGIISDLIAHAVGDGKSVAVFVSFRETVDALQEICKKTGLLAVQIVGDQPERERQLSVERFQANLVHVALCTVQAGGVGVSLHDLHGRPRESIISPPYSAKDLKQCLGRIHRAGAKSKAIQRIVYIAETVEEQACMSVRRKLDNLGTLNDGDLSVGAGF